jgi:hypothetical protein
MVLALDGAPPGVRGISQFIVPKFWVNADGTRRAQRRELRVHRTQAGIHASRPRDVHGEGEGALGCWSASPTAAWNDVRDDERRAAPVGLRIRAG